MMLWHSKMNHDQYISGIGSLLCILANGILVYSTSGMIGILVDQGAFM